MRWLLVLLALAACDTPSPHFKNAPATRLTVEGSTFDIRRRGRLAEAVRVNQEYAPRLGRIALRAQVAMEAATNCAVREVRGDASMILGILDCDAPKGVPARMPRVTYVEIECEVVDVFVPAGGATGYLEADCA